VYRLPTGSYPHVLRVYKLERKTMKMKQLSVPLSFDGWNRIEEISQDMPKLTLAEIIEKALVIAWNADNGEFA
jgi:hypothetical protein